MKNLFAFILFFVIFQQINCRSSTSKEWEQFKVKFQKEYTNGKEDERRMMIYKKNKKMIEDHNGGYEKGVHTYKMKINQFTDLESFELPIQCYKQKQLQNSDGKNNFTTSPHTKLPKHIDWREKGAVTDVKNQKYCGSCWAFSAIGALEGQYFKKTGKLITLSEQLLIDCSKREPYFNEGCCGGLMESAFLFAKYYGFCSENLHPYKEKDQWCRYCRPQGIAKGYVAITTGNEEHLKEAIATIGPVSVATSLPPTFYTYGEGVYFDNHCSNTSLTHALLVVGYGTDKKHGDYWLLKNSWGKSWGMDGYIKMARNRNNNCGIATKASYPQL